MNVGLEVHELTITDAIGAIVLERASLRVQRGALVAVRGPSGSGKSTLIHAALGALPSGLRRMGGTISWAGKPLPSGATARRWRRAEVGICAQESGASLHPHRTILDLVLEGAPDRRDARGRAIDLLEALGIAPALLSRRPGQLSGGQAQRVALVRALLPRPVLLVVDEPTRGLDSHSAAQVYAQLITARDAGAAVLAVTHDHRLVALADEVVTLQPVAVSETRSSVRDRPVLSSQSPVILELDNLVLAQPAGGSPVLQADCLQLRAGERVAVLGASGSGKTTLLRAVAGLHPPESGGILLTGAPVGAARTRTKADRAAVQVVGQNPFGELNPAHRVRTAIHRPLRVLRGHTRQDARRLGSQALEDLGLAPQLGSRFPSALSGGQRQRVALARALAVAPSVLLADEPTSALDAATAQAIMSRIDAACENGLAVLFATHDEELARWADRRFVIDGGRLIEQHSTDAPD